MGNPDLVSIQTGRPDLAPICIHPDGSVVKLPKGKVCVNDNDTNDNRGFKLIQSKEECFGSALIKLKLKRAKPMMLAGNVGNDLSGCRRLCKDIHQIAFMGLQGDNCYCDSGKKFGTAGKAKEPTACIRKQAAGGSFSVGNVDKKKISIYQIEGIGAELSSCKDSPSICTDSQMWLNVPSFETTVLKTAAECSEALGELGFNTRINHNGNWGHVPSGCSGTTNPHFNANAAGNGRGDLAPLCTSESKDECQGEKCKQEECCQVVPLPTCAGTENICDGKNSDGVQLFDIKADTNLHTFIGCFKDDWDRAMPINAGNVGKDVSKCAELFKAKSMPFMGLQHDDCFCSKTKAEYSKHGKREDTECSVQVNGGTAGGDWRNSVYTVDDIKCSKLAGCEVSECCIARDSCSSGDKQNGLCSKDKGLE